MLQRWQRKRIGDLNDSNWSLEDDILKKRALVNIAVIDDDKFEPLKNLLAEGYRVSWLEDFTDTPALKPYEIIVCDVNELAKDKNSEEHGAAVIAQIKHVFPEKFVIAYSSLPGHIKKLRLARERADEYIPKAAQPDIWYITLDNFIKRIFDPKEVWVGLKCKLEEQEVSTQEIAKIESAYVKAILGGSKEPILKLRKKGKLSPGASSILSSLAANGIWALLLPGMPL